MRLLEYGPDGEFTLTGDLICSIPLYAILSHTWGPSSEEVTYRDLVDGTGKTKAGYKKLRFCAEQARRDGLRYFWVDTCCIDKSTSDEVQASINSMFRWYRDAARCYVYLSDVSTTIDQSQPSWEPAFRASRWFTRGWTLQELLAPASVEFFAHDGQRLGDKRSLEQQIHEITGIALPALQGTPLSQFDTEERFKWAETRQTAREEDSAYCLLGIFGIFMPLIYGERKAHAISRLKREIAKATMNPNNTSDSTRYQTPFSLQGVPASNRFVARTSVTAELEECLLPQHRLQKNQRRIFVLYGLGGVGKTQLAADFARRHQATFSAIFWLDGRSEDRLRQSLVSCANRIPEGQIPERSRNRLLNGEDDLKVVIADVLDWLARPDNTDWLLIFDNIDRDYEQASEPGAYDVRGYLPGDHGSVLITTRLSRLAQLGDSTRLKQVDEQLGKAIFQKWRGADLAMDEAGRQLLRLLGGLPLALAQAASYLRETGLDVASYVRLYKQQWDDLMGSNGDSGSPLMDYEQGSVGTTWIVSFKAIEARSKNAANLLRLWAFVDNRDMWHGLLRAAAEGGEQRPEWLCEIARNEISYLDAVRLLLRYSMVEAQESVPMSYVMHPVVHRWASHIQDGAARRENLRLAIMVVGLLVPMDTEKNYWVLQQRLLPHAERCSSWIGDIYGVGGVFDDITVLDAFHKLGILYSHCNRLDDAEAMYQRALQGKEKVLGPNHKSTLDTVHNLGILYGQRSRLDNAEAMYQRALQGYERAFGPDHTLTLNTINNLGVLYRQSGQLDDAEAMYQQALQGKEKVLGPDHESTLATINNLGVLYEHRGQPDNAEAMYQRALQGKEKVLGPNHTSTLDTVHNLGILYEQRGQLDDAEAMYQRALQGKEEVLGPDHTSTLDTINNLGVLYEHRGQLDNAEAMYQRALQGYETALGRHGVNNHLPALRTTENLAGLHAKQGRVSEARTFYIRCQAGLRAVLGVQHDWYRQVTRALEALDLDT